MLCFWNFVLLPVNLFVILAAAYRIPSFECLVFYLFCGRTVWVNNDFFFIFSILQHLLFLFLGLCWHIFRQVHGDLSVHTNPVPSSVGPPSMIVRSSHSMVGGQVTSHIPHERDSLGRMPRNRNTGFLRWLNWLLSPRQHGRIPAHVFQNLKMFETQL